MRTIPTLSLSAVAALAVCAPASAATVSPTHVRFPQVAVNPSGRTVVAWERLTNRRFAVEARIGGVPQKLGATRRLARQGFTPQVAVGEDGTVAVQWMEFASDRNVDIRVAVARPGHGLGKSRLLQRRRANMAPLGVVVQPNGRVVALWRRSGTRVGYALAARGHRFGRARNLAIAGSLSPRSIALDPRDGTVVLAHATLPGLTVSPVARTLTTAAAAFSEPAVIPGSGPLDAALPFAVSGAAGAGVAYTQQGLSALNVARLRPDGSWATQRIAIPSYGQDSFAREHAATLSNDGAAAGAWSVVHDSTDPFAPPLGTQTAASVALASAPFGTPLGFTPDGSTFGPPQLASAGDDSYLATAEKDGGRVLLATRGTGADRFQAPVALTTKGDGDVVLAAGGAHVLVAYQQGDRLRLKVAR
jgi:hypothetical protein